VWPTLGSTTAKEQNKTAGLYYKLSVSVLGKSQRVMADNLKVSNIFRRR